MIEELSHNVQFPTSLTVSQFGLSLLVSFDPLLIAFIDPRQSNIHTLVDGSILLLLNSSQKQLGGLRGVARGRQMSLTARYLQRKYTSRRNHLAAYSLLLVDFLSLLLTFSSQPSVTGSTCSRTWSEFRHPLRSERLELHHRFNYTLLHCWESPRLIFP